MVFPFLASEKNNLLEMKTRNRPLLGKEIGRYCTMK
jgi:hypothetical protein